MKTETITEGVAAEYNGQYWGIVYQDGHSTSYAFGPLESATIADPEYCKTPTGLTWNPENTNGINPAYDQLLKARLVKVRKTVTVEVIP